MEVRVGAEPKRNNTWKLVSIIQSVLFVVILASITAYGYVKIDKLTKEVDALRKENSDMNLSLSKYEGLEEKVTVTPTPSVTSAPKTSQTPTVTAVPTTTTTSVPTKTYTDSDIKFTFTYDTKLTVVPGKHNVIESGMGYKEIIVQKDANTKLKIYYAYGGGIGCMSADEGKITSGDAVFTNSHTGENILRYRNTVDGKVYVKYYSYSAAVNGQGKTTNCDTWINFGLEDASQLNSSGIFMISIEAANVNQDFSSFDNILKSIKRI
jgi:hypothetical protein